MSNHMFDELDETCDYVGFIKDGRIIDSVDVEEIHNRPYRNFVVGFYNKEDFDKAFVNTKIQVVQRVENFLQIVVKVDMRDLFPSFRRHRFPHGEKGCHLTDGICCTGVSRKILHPSQIYPHCHYH